MDAPPDVRFAVQCGKSQLLDPSDAAPGVIRFEFALRLGPPRPDGAFNFLGDFAQGPPSDRFVYINSGTLAGQTGSPWTRRAKLKLASIPRHLVEEALSGAGRVVEARVAGTLGDGGPVCASVKPEAVVWALASVP